MGAPTEVYVDPSIAADSGAGTSGDPYGDLQYALNQVTRDATNGDRFNVKAGTDEILAAGLTLATYGTPAIAAPLFIQGYTTTAGDGGKGGVDCAGTYSLFTVATYSFVGVFDMHVHNGGSATLIDMDNDCQVCGCEVNNTSGRGIDIDNGPRVFGNYIHDVGSEGIYLVSTGFVGYNYLANGTKSFTDAIAALVGGLVYRNIIDIGGSTNGIVVSTGVMVISNSIYSPSGTGDGIKWNGTLKYIYAILNNVIQGFNGTGGVGIETTGSNNKAFIMGGNTVGGSADTVEVAMPDKVWFLLEATEDVGASNPFTDAANQDFTPADVGSMKEGALPGDYHSASPP